MKIKRKNLFATLEKFNNPLMNSVAESYFPNMNGEGKLKFTRKNILNTIENFGYLPGSS